MALSKMEIARRFADLPVDRQASFLQAVKQRGIDFAQLPIFPKHRVSGRLSHAQARQFFLWRLDEQRTAYHISGALRLTGDLDIEVVRRCFEQLLARHESLRTAFRELPDGAIEQVVRTAGDLEFTAHDLSDVTLAERDSRALEVALTVAGTPFDLRQGRPLRVGLIRLAADEHVLVVVMHHIVSDGWSMRIIVDEFVELYGALNAGREPKLNSLPIQYLDYAAWQRSWLEAGEQDRQLQYWKQTLGATHPVLELAPTRGRAAGPRTAGHHSFELPAALIDGLRRCAREHRATLFMMLLTGLQALLHRYTGERDIRVGTTQANRGRAETQGVVGFFVNTQVLRTEVESSLSLQELLARVRSAVAGAQEHQDLPFEQLVEALQPARELDRQPLFQVLMDHQRGDYGRLADLPGLTVQSFPLGEQEALFDLWINTTEQADGRVKVQLSYAADSFDADRIERLGAHYLHVLQALAHEPARAVGEVQLLSDSEHGRLTGWGRIRQQYSGTPSLPEWIEREVARAPDAIAISDADRRITYAQLNARANAIAHRLIACGVKPESRVGLALERSAELVIAMLGILKAGGAYVPVDPAYPQERLEYLLRDSGVSLVLTQQSLLPKLPQVSGVHLLPLESVERGSELQANPDVPLHPDNLAYVIYTSGSTGRPKGAQLTHRNVVRLLQSCQERFQVGASDVWTLFHSYAFDFSVWEIFGALCFGGRLVVVPYAVSRSPEEFAQLLKRERVTVLSQTPSAFSQLLQVAVDEEKLPLRYVVFGGEALNPQLLIPWLEKHGESTQLINMYGITETTVHVTYRRIGEADTRHAISPIGQGLGDLGLQVLDERLNLVPAGVAGELYVMGAGLARGYLKRPGLSAERFVADPGSANGERMYRTGDRVRWSESGRLEYLGRIDEQVKIRGFRIELGEIQGQLLQLPGVAEAAVVVQEQGDRRLLAYVVPDPSVTAGPTQEAEGLSSEDLVAQWESVFDSSYQGAVIEPNFRGWNDSFDGKPIPEAEMEEWLRDTVARIRALRPRSVLEIGCGVGLIVRELAGEIPGYVATDFSTRAIKDLGAWLRTQPQLSHVQLRQRAATDFSDIAPGSVDVVVLNSVAQYFPDVDYLVRVLEGAARILAPGGYLFVGDIRHLAHREMFHASVQLAQASSSLTIKQLRGRIHRSLTQEKELLLDPAFFHEISASLGWGRARILLKRGRFANELSRYRYDVLLGRDIAELRPTRTIEWDPGMSASWQPGIRVQRVPNRRMARDYAAWQAIERADERATVGEILAGLDAATISGIDPADLWDHGEREGCEVRVGWTEGVADGSMDVEFFGADDLTRANTPGVTRQPPSDNWRSLVVSRALSLASHPLIAVRTQQWGARVRERLALRLPDYMLPAQIVVLDRLPLTTNGKLDRKALPEPDAVASTGYEPPQGAMEEALSRIWSTVLGVGRVGRHDNFFELGGDSILSLRLVAQARESSIAIAPRQVFEHQTLRALAEAVSRGEGASTTTDRIPVLSDEARSLPLALSHAQSRLLFLWRLDEQSTAYHMRFGIRLRGSLDAATVRASFAALIDRHESLRTVFRLSPDGSAQQIVRPAGELSFTSVDLGSLAPDHREKRAAEAAERLVATPFDLTAGPLFRVGLLRLATDEHVLIVVMHHIVSDGWSMQIVAQDFVELYRAQVSGKAARLQALSLQYPDFAVWQRGWLDASEQKRQLDYWRRQLGDEHPVLLLPTDRPRPASPRYREASHPLELPSELVKALQARAREHRASLFMVLLAGFQALLHRYTGEPDIRIGVPNANRQSPEVQGVVGFFVNTQILRSRFDGEMTWRDLLRQTRETVLDAQEHQDLPFDQLVHALQPQRELSHQPLFRVRMNHLRQDYRSMADLPGLTLETYGLGDLHAIFELTLTTVEYPDGDVGATLLYASELFDASTIERFGQHYLCLLRAIAGRPNQPLSRVALLTESEERRMALLGHERRERADEELIHRLIERAAECHPDVPAVSCEGESLSYRELSSRADRLAQRLMSHGVRSGDRVAIVAERSIPFVVSLLAVLKAGAAFIPLDPQVPPDRLRYMITDGGAVLALRTSDAKWEADVPIIAVDEPDRDNLIGAATLPVVHSSQTAYVIFTSGSSGKPKGVEVTHRSLANYVRGVLERLALPETASRMAMVSTVAADLGHTVLFGALCSGRALHLISADTALNADRFAEYMTRHDIHVLKIVPSHLQMLLGASRPQDALPRHTLVLGGEPTRWPLLDEIQRLRPVCRVFNHYGPTETTVGVLTQAATVAYRRAGSLPIGRLLPGVRGYVLDASLNAVPPAVAGELYLAGEAVAQGYRRRSALTAERFVPDPFATGERMYRSGDRVRRLPDGAFEYLGRVDDQIKVRGFRVELGEIEAQLRAQPGVRQAAVIAREDEEGGGARLFAYLVAAEEALTTAGEAQSQELGEVIGQWETVFDQSYEGDAATLDFRGWNSSYTDQPIAEVEMVEWLDQTVRRIRSLGPRNVLEIGCGIGLLVQALAPVTASYLATDFSARAVRNLNARRSRDPGLESVEARQVEAAHVSRVATGHYDTVLLNSVVQYFPDADYLARVLRSASAVLTAEGRIFVGDVRHLEHLGLFHASVQLARAPATLSVRKLRSRIERAIAQDKELLLNPSFFEAVAAHCQLGSVECLLKRGRFDDEMTRYRYDVILGRASIERPPSRTFDGSVAGWQARLRSVLADERPAALSLRTLPNRRLARDLAAWRAINAADETLPVRQLLEQLRDGDTAGVDPESLWSLGDALGYRVEITWSRGEPGHMDVLFVEPSCVGRALESTAAKPLPASWRSHANDPLKVLRTQQWVSGLRGQLARTLPDYMLPAQFAVLPALPVTSNGKLDRRALPELGYTTSSHFEAPEGAEEELLAKIWSEALGVDRVGRRDNFFELGGHSLLMARVLERMRESSDLWTGLTLVDLMQQPTIQGLVRSGSGSSRLAQPVVRLNEADRPTPLFCIHAAGGGVFSYLPLARALSGTRTVFGIACRSHVDPAHRDTSALQMARDYAALIRETQPHGPYQLLGHSLGGLLAALTAGVLEEAGCEVRFLGLVDSSVPTLEVRSAQDPDHRKDFIAFLRTLQPDAAIEDTSFDHLDLSDLESQSACPALVEALGALIESRRPELPPVTLRPEEIVTAFVIYQRLSAINRQPATLAPLKVRPHCWWTETRTAADRESLRAQVCGRLHEHDEIRASHEDIVKCPEFLATLAEALTMDQNVARRFNTTLRGSP